MSAYEVRDSASALWRIAYDKQERRVTLNFRGNSGIPKETFTEIMKSGGQLHYTINARGHLTARDTLHVDFSRPEGEGAREERFLNEDNQPQLRYVLENLAPPKEQRKVRERESKDLNSWITLDKDSRFPTEVRMILPIARVKTSSGKTIATHIPLLCDLLYALHKYDNALLSEKGFFEIIDNYDLDPDLPPMKLAKKFAAGAAAASKPEDGKVFTEAVASRRAVTPGRGPEHPGDTPEKPTPKPDLRRSR